MKPWKYLFLCVLLLASCTSRLATPVMPTKANMAPMYIPKPGVTQQIPSPTQIIPTAISLPNSQTIDVSIWVPPYLAETLRGALQDSLQGLIAEDEAKANVHLEVENQNIVSQWVYALVTPFSSKLQGISADDLLARWKGGAITGYGNQPLLMDANTYGMFTALWGPAAEASVQILTKQELIDYAWSHQPALAIVPLRISNHAGRFSLSMASRPSIKTLTSPSIGSRFPSR